MDTYMIVILAEAGAIILLTAVIAFNHIGHKRKIREKDCAIVRLIRGKDRVEKELEQARVEKSTLEGVLKNRLDGTGQPGDDSARHNQESSIKSQKKVKN